MQYRNNFMLLLIMVFINSAQGQNRSFTYQVNFKSNEHVLDVGDNAILDSLFCQANQSSYYEIYLQAHTDNNAGDSYNIQLSSKRAQAVKDYLLEKELKSARIISKAFGEKKPKTDNNTPTGKADNRRVEIILNTYCINSTNDVLNEIRPDYKQTYTILTNQNNTIKGSNGTNIIIPANTITTLKGLPVQGSVNIVLEEYLKPADAAFNQLSTASNGRLLESGGMFSIKAYSMESKEELKLNEGSSMTVYMPTINMRNNMSLFTAVQNTDGTTEWKMTSTPFLPKGLEKNETTKPVKLDVNKLDKWKVACKWSNDTPSFVYRLPKKPEHPQLALKYPKMVLPQYKSLFNWRERLFYPKSYLSKLYKIELANRKKYYEKRLAMYLKKIAKYDSLLAKYKKDSIQFETVEFNTFKNWLEEQAVKHQQYADFYERMQWNRAIQNLIEQSNNSTLVNNTDLKQQFLRAIGPYSYGYATAYAHKMALTIIDYYKDLSMDEVMRMNFGKAELSLNYYNNYRIRGMLMTNNVTYAQNLLDSNNELLKMLDIARGQVISSQNSRNTFNENKVAKVYETALSNFGMFNCDRFYNQPQNSMATINIPFEGDAKVAFFVPSLNSFMYASKTDFGYTAQMPKGTEVKIIFVSYHIKEGPLLCIKQTKFTDNLTLDIEAKPSTLKEIKEVLKNI